jgi:dTDP-4-amino-4,6-dideoxygalactose transaminase
MTAFTLRTRPVPGLGLAAIGSEEEALVLEVLRSKALFRYNGLDPATPPAMTALLEKEFREYIGTTYALAVTSGSGALEVAMAAAGIGPGDEVIVTAWSWIACFTAIVRIGAKPVLAEIDESLNLDPKEIARLTTPRTRAVLVIHYQGAPADMERIQHEAHRRGLFVIEDCAQSIGSSYRGRKVGTWSDIATFSFQANKTMTSGEGGMVVTRDGWLYERAVRFHDLGNYRLYHAGIQPARGEAFAGGQFRMSELTAAVALAQLRKLDGLRAHCRALRARIVERIAGLAGLTLRCSADDDGDFGFELYLFFKDAAEAGAFRDNLDARNVNCGARTGTYPQYHRDYVKNGRAHSVSASPFRGITPWPAPGYRAEDFPRTEELTKRFVAIPLGWLYTMEDADYIAAAIVTVSEELGLAL